jgi:hypothetical protein
VSVLALDDAKAHLNITSDTSDDELQTFIDAAESRLAAEVGALEPTSRTDRVVGGSALVLPALPVVGLTSVTPADGDALDTDDLHIDAAAGVITSESGATFPARHYDVAYTVGMVEAQPHIIAAVKELVRHLWKTQRGQLRPDAEAVDGPTWQKALELVARDTARQSGFA